MTITSNVFKPIIINGKPVKSINQYYNKKIASNKSLIMSNFNAYTSKLIKNLYARRDYKIKDYFHKASKMVIDILLSNNISTLVIGKNKNWKQGVNLGKITNQNFVQIPFNKLIDMLKYKAETYGIKVVVISESYTSKSSFLDLDKIPNYKKGKTHKFSGRRIKRGLYKSKEGLLLNADVNGSLNILRKYLTVNKYWSDELFINLKFNGFSNPKLINVA